MYQRDEKTLCDANREKLINDNEEAQGERNKWDKMLASAVFLSNIVMLLSNLAASILSGSYSVIRYSFFII